MIYRDEKTKALINTDAAALNKYKLERENFRRVEKLAEELNEVKHVLNKLCVVIERMEIK
jgi:hypothetical protein